MTMRPLAFRGTSCLALLATAATALTACTDSLDPPGQRDIAIASIVVDGDVSTTQAAPRISFFRADGLSVVDSRTWTDDCIGQVVPGTGTTPSVPAISAGNAVALELSGVTTQLLPSASGTGTVYVPASNAKVAITNGDSAKFRVPGVSNGYPALTFAIKTAEALTIQPIAVPSATGTDNVAVSWNAGDANSALALTLSYTTGAGVRRQIVCFVQDDGVFAIPDDVLDGWRATTTTGRSGVALRFRTNNASPNSNAIAFGVSSFSKTVTIEQP